MEGIVAKGVGLNWQPDGLGKISAGFHNDDHATGPVNVESEMIDTVNFYFLAARVENFAILRVIAGGDGICRRCCRQQDNPHKRPEGAMDAILLHWRLCPHPSRHSSLL